MSMYQDDEVPSGGISRKRCFAVSVGSGCLLKPRFELTEQAQTDILDIWCYIARDNPAAADRIVDCFMATYNRLAQSPGLGVAQDQYRPGCAAFLSPLT